MTRDLLVRLSVVVAIPGGGLRAVDGFLNKAVARALPSAHAAC
jgi:hypothetical protein